MPMERAIEALNEYLERNKVKKLVYIDVAKKCMEQNFFQFRGTFCAIEHGSMGNPLSPLIAELLFMAQFETKLKTDGQLPQRLRYVDDIFAVVKQSELNDLLALLNDQYATNNFTIEKEVNNTLPFLDLLVRKVNGKIMLPFIINQQATNVSYPAIHIARVNTQKLHFIFMFTDCANCHYQSPTSKENTNIEHIKEIADLNG